LPPLGELVADEPSWVTRRPSSQTVSSPARLAVRAEAADRKSLRRIQDLLTARLTVAWQDLGG
jgi:hypothetical protein